MPAPTPSETMLLSEDRRALGVLYLRQLRIMWVGHLLVGGLTGYLMWSRLGGWLPWAWFGLLIGVVGLRQGVGARYGRRLPELALPELHRLEWLHALLAGLTGLAWGALPWLVSIGHDSYMDFFVAAALLGMTGGAVTPLAALAWAFPFFAGAAMLPLILKFLLVGGEIYLAGGLSCLFYLGILSIYHRNGHRTMAEAIRLRRENAHLVAELRTEKTLAEEAARIKSLFLAGVSHDLKHPLYSLRLYLGYLKSLPPGAAVEGVAKTLPGMEQALAGMAGQLARLLDLSRLEEGGVVANPAALPMRDLFEHCRAQFASAAAEKSLTLRFVPTAAVVSSDPAMLQSILDNLVANALRYTERGGVLVGVRRRGGGYDLCVYDSGPGIAAERLPLLFEAYRRFDDTVAGNQAGHGLGLALVRKQAELLGCRVEVASTPGRGSVFALRGLPAA